MSPARLIDVATQLTLSSNDTPEHQERLRRAVSTAYYAIFHFLANSNANALIGDPTNDNDAAAWNRTYRALEHGAARSRFRHARSRFRHTGHMDPFPRVVKEFANTFNRLQGERYAADYNPGPTFTVSGALRTIDQARQEIIRFGMASPEVRRDLATHVLFGNRPE